MRQLDMGPPTAPVALALLTLFAIASPAQTTCGPDNGVPELRDLRTPPARSSRAPPLLLPAKTAAPGKVRRTGRRLHVSRRRARHLFGFGRLQRTGTERRRGSRRRRWADCARRHLHEELAEVKQEVTVSEENTSQLSVQPTQNADALVIKGADLESLPDDPDDLQQDLQALAGPSAGRTAGKSLSMASPTAACLPRNLFAKSASIRIRFPPSSTSSVLAASKSLPSRVPTNSTEPPPTTSAMASGMPATRLSLLLRFRHSAPKPTAATSAAPSTSAPVSSSTSSAARSMTTASSTPSCPTPLLSCR